MIGRDPRDTTPDARMASPASRPPASDPLAFTRILRASLLMAGWCVGSVWGLLELTRPLPGVLTFEGTRGAYELLEMATGLSTAAALSSAFAVLCVAFVLGGLLFRWLDREGEVRSAIRWSFSSRSLNAWAFVLTGAALLLMLWPWSEAPQAASGRTFALPLTLACLVVFVLLPFALLHPDRLQAPQPSRWWRPAWPGFVAVTAGVALVLLLPLFDAVIVGVLERLDRPTAALVTRILTTVVESLAMLVAVAVWLGRGDEFVIGQGLRRAFRIASLKAWFAYPLAWWWLVLPVVAPILGCAVLVFYVIPQYESWAELHRTALPPALQYIGMLGRRAQANGSLSLLLVSVAMLGPYLLGVGRLLVRYGVGERHRSWSPARADA